MKVIYQVLFFCLLFLFAIGPFEAISADSNITPLMQLLLVETDCAGDKRGAAYLDNCSNCVGGNTGLTACTEDCAGVWGGLAQLDNCGNCDTNPLNDCTIPSIQTVQATTVAETSANSGGTNLSDGGADITSKGVCCSKSQVPVTPCTDEGGGTGSFTSDLNGLDFSTLYYYRAYATNSQGTSYGEEHSFTTTTPSSCKTIIEMKPSSTTGFYTIDPDGAGGQNAIEVYCEMTVDGGGYTYLKVDNGTELNALEAESYCSTRGMQLFIPRNLAHRNASIAIARSTGIGPGGSDLYMRILGIYPDYNGATCALKPFRSGTPDCDWSASDGAGFYVSDRTDVSDPNGDNDTTSSMYYQWQVSGEVEWYNDVISPGYTSQYFMCDVGDKF